MDIMTKVRVLWEKVAGITADVSAVDAKATATAATLAGILPRIPADYSATETNTGQKWIDGKDIYSKVISIDLPVIETSSNITVASDITFVDTLVKSDVLLYKGNNKNVNRYYIILNGSTLQILSVTSSYSEGKCNVIMYYTKPDPVPGTREDPEPETRKRKTTKKEDK